jgi:ABC-type glutathione transport system ATPase component
VTPDLATVGERPILSVRGLRKEFRSRGRTRIVAVDDVSFDVLAGQTTALVGESGSGKSTLSRLIMGLHRADRGTVELDGVPLHSLRGRRLRRERSSYQMVFQNPLLSFDPVYSIGTSIWEVMRLASPEPGEREIRIGELLTSVGLAPAFAAYTPRRVSGGELQRAAIARAMSANPKVLVLDEPTSALDVSIQAQVLDLLVALQRERGTAYLMSTHDLPMVRRISHEVIVLFRGRIVERAPTTDLFAAPVHPYTISLLAARSGPEAVAAARLPAVTDDGPCPLTHGTCAEPHHLVETSPRHLVRCWRHYDGPGLVTLHPAAGFEEEPR